RFFPECLTIPERAKMVHLPNGNEPLYATRRQQPQPALGLGLAHTLAQGLNVRREACQGLIERRGNDWQRHLPWHRRQREIADREHRLVSRCERSIPVAGSQPLAGHDIRRCDVWRDFAWAVLWPQREQTVTQLDGTLRRLIEQHDPTWRGASGLPVNG